LSQTSIEQRKKKKEKKPLCLVKDSKKTNETNAPPKPERLKKKKEGEKQQQQQQHPLLTMDILAFASMKDIAKCDMKCELQNPASHFQYLLNATCARRQLPPMRA